MTTYTKETALYDTGAIGDDIEEAGTKATSYITQISQNQGIWITPSDHKPDPSTGEPVTTGNNKTRGWRIKDALEMFWEGISYIWAGITNNIATVRVGKETGGHSVIDENGMRVYGSSGGNVTLANIGYGPGTDSGGGTSDAPYYMLGTRTGTVGNYSVGEGYNVEASGYASHAEGYESIATGSESHAEGNSIARGICSHAEGLSEAVTQASHAEGVSKASGFASHSQNYHTEAAYNYQTAIGKYNDNYNKNAFEIGNGTADNARSNALTVDWGGDVCLALDTTASSGTTDGDLYAAITALGWQSDVIV